MKHASADGKGTASLGTKERLIRARNVAIMALLVAVLAGEVDAAAPGTGNSPRPAGQGRVPAITPPVVTLLKSGTEPRKVLRFQPKAGDKQIVAFTMKMAMDPSPLTNLPPIVGTMQITIKSVSATGEIAYERIITDVSVSAGAGTTAQDKEFMQVAFSKLKGLTTSGVISSRGFIRRTDIKIPKSGEALPAIARLFLTFMNKDLLLIAAPLPEEAVGVGGEWEVKPAQESPEGVEKAVYEIISIEGQRVSAKVTVTMSPSNQAPKGLTATGGGVGETTIDLGRIMPTKGNLAHRLEGSGPVGGQDRAMKIQTYLRIDPN